MRAPHLIRWPRRLASAPEDALLLRRTALRLGVQAVVTVAAIVLLLALVALLVVLRNQNLRSDRVLSEVTAKPTDVTHPPPGVWLIIDGPGGQAATPGIPTGLPDQPAIAQAARTGETSTRELHADGAGFRVRTQRRGDTVVQAALDLGLQQAERAELIRALLLSGGLALLLAAIAGAWLGRRAVQPLAAANALQRRFVADASHELRTPLTLLSTRAQMLRRQLRHHNLEKQLQADIDGLVGDAAHLAVILDDLLLAVDPRTHTPVENVDLAELVEQVTTAADALAEHHRVTIDRAYATQQVCVRATPAGLRRALTALVDNAVRHAHSQVTVTVADHRTHASVVVTDNGPGIDPVILSRVFDRFAATPAPTGQQRRYGLGLALVAEIAHRYGGSVAADNAAGGGAALRLTLPKTKPPKTSRPKPL